MMNRPRLSRIWVIPCYSGLLSPFCQQFCRLHRRTALRLSLAGDLAAGRDPHKGPKKRSRCRVTAWTWWRIFLPHRMIASHRCLGFGAWFFSRSWTFMFGAAVRHGSTQNSEELRDDRSALRVVYFINEPASSCSSAVLLTRASDNFIAPVASIPSGRTPSRQLLAQPDSGNRRQ